MKFEMDCVKFEICETFFIFRTIAKMVIWWNLNLDASTTPFGSITVLWQ